MPLGRESDDRTSHLRPDRFHLGWRAGRGCLGRDDRGGIGRGGRGDWFCSELALRGDGARRRRGGAREAAACRVRGGVFEDRRYLALFAATFIGFKELSFWPLLLTYVGTLGAYWLVLWFDVPVTKQQ